MDRRKRQAGLTRRQVLKLSAGGAAAAYLAGGRGTADQSKERPNILFLMADQHRADCVGTDGNAVIHTPNLDRIAGEGARFRCAYSCTPTCTPARAALLSGCAPWRNGMLGYGRVAEKYPVELPQALRDAGYYTLGIGKMHWHPQRILHGFHNTILDESSRAETPDFLSDYRAWFNTMAPNLVYDATGIGWNDYRSAPYAPPEELHPSRWMGDVATRFLETYQRPEPFFLKVSFARPHSPYDPPQRWLDFYADADLPKAREGAWAERYRERSDDSFSIWHGDLGPEQVRRSRQGYYGSVSFIDEQIGRVLESLEKRGWLENTLILYTVDHGDMTGDHHLWRKSYAYEASARIPMLLRWPEGLVSGARGQVIDRPTELRDVMPTFLDAAGTSVEEVLDGRSLLDLARGKAEGWREYIDLEHDVCYDKTNHWNGLTDGHTKYIYHAFEGEEQLFDLDADPGEERDLAGDPAHGDRLDRWRKRLVAHLEERGPDWVRNGKLMPRPGRMLYSPNYPGASA